jgi:hypothetical protein
MRMPSALCYSDLTLSPRQYLGLSMQLLGKEGFNEL